jgi:hypothetical protein
LNVLKSVITANLGAHRGGEYTICREGAC